MAAGLLVDAAVEAGVQVFVQPSIAFVYPGEGEVDESTRIEHLAPHLQSALEAEAHALHFTVAGRRGVVARFGLLYGLSTGADEPNPLCAPHLRIADAGAALVATLAAPSGLYNAVRDSERVSNARFKLVTGWIPCL